MKLSKQNLPPPKCSFSWSCKNIPIIFYANGDSYICLYYNHQQFFNACVGVSTNDHYEISRDEYIASLVMNA